MSSVAKMIETIETQMDAETDVSDSKVGPLTAANPEHLRMVEALLFAASEPLDQKALSTSLPGRRRFARPAGGASDGL